MKLIRQTLTVQDVKSLIEILLSHNSQEMKYWLPKDILSVLNNEEVSAYLLAYLNTQDMIPSPRSVKKNSKSNRKQKRDECESTADIGVDFNFDLFAFDKSNLHQNSLVVGCTEIYKKFK
jgi:hypothetical protein